MSVVEGGSLFSHWGRGEMSAFGWQIMLLRTIPSFDTKVLKIKKTVSSLCRTPSCVQLSSRGGPYKLCFWHALFYVRMLCYTKYGRIYPLYTTHFSLETR